MASNFNIGQALAGLTTTAWNTPGQGLYADGSNTGTACVHMLIMGGTQPVDVRTGTSALTGTAPALLANSISTPVLAIITFPVGSGNTVNTATTAGGSNITFSTISGATTTACGTGTATWFRLLRGSTTVVPSAGTIATLGTALCDGTVGAGVYDLNLNTASITSGATVAVTSFSIIVTRDGNGAG